MYNSFIFLTLCLALTSQLVSAKQESARTCRILYLSAPAGAAKTLQLFDGKSSREVELPRKNLSKVYKLDSGLLNLRMSVERVTGERSIPEAAPSVIVPEKFKHIYLIIKHDPENKVVPVKMEVINASYERIKYGEMLWVNYTKTTLKGTIGSRELEIKPEEQTIVNDPSGGERAYNVEIDFQAEGKKDFRPLIESRWRHNPRSRSLAFIIDEDKRKAPRIFSFSDFRIIKK